MFPGEVVDKVKDYINSFLNLSKTNFHDPTRDDFIELKSISEVLEELSLTEQEYENALKICDDNSYQLYLRRPTDSCFFNNYFYIGCVHGRQILTFSQYLIIIKLSHICAAFYQNKRNTIRP